MRTPKNRANILNTPRAAAINSTGFCKTYEQFCSFSPIDISQSVLDAPHR